MPRKQTYVIAGAGLAGAKAAETLREEGFDGRVVLIGDEPERPYERPPLSKGYLRGEKEADGARVHAAGFYSERRIELRTRTTVTAIDRSARELRLGGSERLPYDRLLIATGAEPRRLPVPGSDLDGIHHLRTLADADALRARLRPGARLVVIGGGWIGSEVAASARALGAEVALVARAGLPLEGALGPELGRLYAGVHADHGVRIHSGARVQRFEGAGRVERVRLAGGGTLDADVVVVGIGASPRGALAARAGIVVDDGVLVDRRLETSAPGVFAAGDVASAYHPLYRRRVRVEHWANALNQGVTAARAMLGRGVSYERLPYFFSDQYDVGMEYSGLASPADELVLRGDPATREFLAFWLWEGRVVAGMSVNVWEVTEAVQRLVRSGRRVDVRRLRDPGVALDELAGAPVAG